MELMNAPIKYLDAMVADGWSAVVDRTDEEFRLALLVPLSSILLFWAVNIPLIVFNFYPSISPIEKWKIQKGKYETPRKVLEESVVVLMNHGLSIALNYAAATNFDLPINTGMQGLPPFWKFCVDMFLCMVLYDTFFYFIHCLMHTKWMYYTFHITHHTAKTSLGVSSSYFHPIDFLLTTGSGVLPPLFISDHLITQFVFVNLLTLETINAHCGYRIPFLPDQRDHDFHHSHSNYASEKYRFVNMGSFFLIWDRLLGTRQPCLDYWAEEDSKKQL